ALGAHQVVQFVVQQIVQAAKVMHRRASLLRLSVIGSQVAVAQTGQRNLARSTPVSIDEHSGDSRRGEWGNAPPLGVEIPDCPGDKARPRSWRSSGVLIC